MSKTGAGKSTLANALLGDRVVRAVTRRGGQSVTTAVEKFTSRDLDQPFVFWDTPGTQASNSARKTFRTIVTELKKKNEDVDLFIMCAPANETRDHPDNRKLVYSLTDVFAKKVCSHAVIVFSQANTVMDPDHEVTTAEFFHEECVTEMKIRYRQLLAEVGGLSPEEAEAVPCIPVGSGVQQRLPDGTNWKKEFWMACVGRVSSDVRGVLMACGNTDQTRFGEAFSGLDKVRMLLGLTLTGGSAGGFGVGIAAGLAIASRIGAAVGAIAGVPTGVGAAIGAVVGIVAGPAILGIPFTAYWLYQRTVRREHVKAYKTHVGIQDSA